jgi:putative sigma-54 modulation protein
MRLVLKGRNVEVTPALRKLVDSKLRKLDRVDQGVVVSAQVELAQERHRCLVDVRIHARGDHMLHGSGAKAAWETSLSDALEKITQQIQKMKGKWQERKRRATPARALPAPEGIPVPSARVREQRVRPPSRYPVKPMTIDEAAMAMEEGGDSFLVFRNAATDSINVVYRRRNGDVGLIEPES